MNYSKILIIEDEKSTATIIESYIEEKSYDIEVAHSGKEGLHLIESFKPDAILLDIRLPDISGLDILRQLREKKWSGGILMVTGETSLNTGVKATQMGADDYIVKPFSAERIKLSLKNILEKKKLETIADAYQEISKVHFEGFIGSAPQMQTMYKILENAAGSEAPVFITGESGTGKELAARAIHNLSKRKSSSLVVVNCAAIPHNLLESELFGHVKGAFTGALNDREGLAAKADGGTLFLDELGEMPMELQPKLLRFVQTGTYTPVGGNIEKRVDIRFVSATNKNPMDSVQQGLLREDLYYRLSVIPVELPPLRLRGSDIILLANHFMEKFAKEEKRSFNSLSPNAEKLLLSYNWPGNIRQLQNIIRHAVVMNKGSVLEDTMLIPAMEQKSSNTSGTINKEVDALMSLYLGFHRLKTLDLCTNMKDLLLKQLLKHAMAL